MGLRLLALACLVGAAFAGPFQRQSQCATRCRTSENEKFNYEPGKKYVYEFEGVNEVIVAGNKKQKAVISGIADLNVITKCEMVLQMRDLIIEEKASHEDIDELRRKLEIPLPFAFQDGTIEHICSSGEESLQSLNIKKAFLSALINSMSRLDQSQEVMEVDSLGTCKTKYTVRSLPQMVIEKEKDLKSCSQRHSSISSLITNPYESPESAIHSAPIFPTDKMTCRQTIENGVIKSSKCKEIASIKPLGERLNVVEFEGHMQLTLSKVESADIPKIESLSAPQPIVYDLQEELSETDLEHEVEELLRNKCSRTTLIDLSASRDFILLVNAAKRMPYESLQRIYTSLENGQLCSSKKVTDLFLDTLPMAGSDGSIRLMVNLLLQHRVTGLKAKLWSASLSLVQHPSQESIQAAADLVKEQKSSKSVLLGVSAMVYRYCLHHKCHTFQPVKDIVTALNQVLGQQCAYENEDEAVAVLKAFGNMGQILHAENNVLACAKNNNIPIRVRLAAIDSFRRVNKKRPQAIVDLYADSEEHYEVRIAALSCALRHADKVQIALIKTVVERDHNEQVSAYAGTLISNMNRTSSPLKQKLRERLNDFEIHTPQVGYWENSKNIELSTFSKTFNVGGGMETDIIHAPDSKIPRSIHTRFDLDVFNNHLNLFEIGLRAEGLEAAFKKLIGYHESKQQKSAWNILKSSDSDDKLEAQFFFRTMNTEIVDFSLSDMNSMGEIMQVADILNKLSHEKTADWSHSFMFVNSKLVIPSVTGRSYSFGLTGSATVGLTAKSKVDIVNIMSRSRNCDVYGHFQPSVNVELAASAGIHSHKPRPDVKIVTRLHSESHIEAQFKIQDSHLGLVKVSVPSENIAYTKISTDIYEVDAHQEEKPIVENMEKKIDVCFDKLEKPLGLSICGKWEVPRPFISKSFPYVRGIGNIEVAIKKTDLGMSSYVLSVEMPRHRNSLMTYKASLDTPGSRINRRFSADLEVRMPTAEQKQFSLEIKSPFQYATASASGSLTTKQELIDASIEVHAGSSKHYSVRATCPISHSDKEKTYRPSIQVSYSSAQPLKIDGSLSVAEGRKQRIDFDLKANKPSEKPLSLKGTIVKEGTLSYAKTSEWKLTSDVAVKSPIINLNVRSSTEKQSKQFHKLSSTLAVDYQTKDSKRESVKLSTNFQKSSSKISSMAQFETSEHPFANFLVTWNMQGKLKESFKNDITLKYGRDQEQFINIIQSSRLNPAQPGECKLAIKAPQFDIDSDLTVSHDIQLSSRVHADIDLRYCEDKHVKAKLHVDRLSEKPLKLKMKAEVQTPSRRMLYQDELEEVSQNSYRGNAAFEWRADQRTELQYKYQKLSDKSKLHHEIETSLRLPSSQSPIKNKASILITSEHVAVEGRVSLDRRSDYSVKAQLHKKGTSYLNLKVPNLEGNLKLVNDDMKKAADLDLKSTLFRQPRHVTASASLGLGKQKMLETEIDWDADKRSESKFLFMSSFEKQTRGKFECKSKLQFLDKVSCEISTSGDLAIYGKHETAVEAKLLKFEPVGLTLRHEMTKSNSKVMLRYSKSQRPKVELSLGAEHLMSSREKQISTTASLKSLDNSFETKRWSYKGSYSRPSESAMTLKSNARLEWSPSKIYECESSYELQPNVILTKASLRTPHLNFERQSLGLSYRKSGDHHICSASVEFLNGKSMSISSETEHQRDSITTSLVFSSPFARLKNLRAVFDFSNREALKRVKSYVDINNARKADMEISLNSNNEVNARWKTSFTPEISLRIKCEDSPSSFLYDVEIMKNAAPLLSASVSKQSTNQAVSYSLESSSQDKKLLILKLVREVSPSASKHMLEASGAFPEVVLNIETSKKDKYSLNVAVQACLKKDVRSCYSLKGYHKSLENDENYRSYRKLTVDVEKTTENSSPRSLASINIISAITGNDVREKLTVEWSNKKVGYEVRLHVRKDEHDHCTLDSHLFTLSNTMRVRGSILHNEESIMTDFEIIPDVSVPARSIGYELKKDKEGNQYTGYLRLRHPALKQPVEISGHIRREGIILVAGKLRLNYAERSQDYILEVVPESTGRRQEKQSIIYKLYREDKSFEASAKLMKYSTRQECEYSYDWKYQSKQGRIALKLSDKVSWKPRLIELEVITPRTTTKLSSRLTWGPQIPTGAQLSLLSDNKNMYEVEIKSEESCLYIDQKIQSKPYLIQEICLMKQDQQKITLMSASCQYRRQKTLEMRIEVNPEQSQFADIDIYWDVHRQIQSVNELNVISDELIAKHFSEQDWHLVQSKIHSWNRFVEDLFWETVKNLRVVYYDFKDTMRLWYCAIRDRAVRIWERLSEYLPLESIRHEVWEPLSRNVMVLYEKYSAEFSKYFDEHLRVFWEKCIRKTVDFVRLYCPEDSVIIQMGEALEKMEFEVLMKILSSSTKDMNKAVSQCWRNVPDVRDFIRRWAERVKEEMHRLLAALTEGQLPQMFAQYVHRLEEAVIAKTKEEYHRVMEWVERILRRLEKYEDFHKLKAFARQCRDQIIILAKKFENFVEKIWNPMWESFAQYSDQWVKERMIVREFSPKEGKVEVQIRHPFAPRHFQVLRNIILSLKNKINAA